MKQLPKYTSSQQFYFREARKSVPPGGVVELEPHVAAEYMKSHPGLLAPAMLNTQAHAEVVRSDETPERRPRGRRKQS